MRSFHMLAIFATMFVASGPLGASEMRFRYDALGRLVSVGEAGPGALNVVYTYDRADNRTSRDVTGGTATVVVTPSGGRYRVIPLRTN